MAIRYKRSVQAVSRRFFWIGLALIAAYWLWVHPPGFGRFGYAGDFCPDFVRQIMADNLQRFGRPVFTTDRFMTPEGASVPFLSWSMERDWIGAYVWRWNRDFPFLWVYFGISLAVSYLGVGWILRRMSLPHAAAWALAAGVVLFNIPRHFKTYYHFEHLPQHWVYWSLFLDAWIWQRFWRGPQEM